ncbi:MAG: transglycosylase domain-containing protein [Deltaproteobacteria bacterium]|nr:transglycosylase domain-containing protein [Deltaproteobacteria bacterium]
MLAFEALYHYALTKVPVLPEPPPAEGTPFIREALWAVEGSRGDHVAALWAWNFWNGFPPRWEGNRYAVSTAARTYVIRFVPHHGKLNWHFQCGATEVWLSRHATADDLKRELAAWGFFGRSAFGIDAAAHAWFCKSSSELSLQQIALLLGTRQSPRHMEDPDWRNSQVRIVLRKLVDAGLVTEEEAHAAASAPLDVFQNDSEPPDPDE